MDKIQRRFEIKLLKRKSKIFFGLLIFSVYHLAAKKRVKVKVDGDVV